MENAQNEMKILFRLIVGFCLHLVSSTFKSFMSLEKLSLNVQSPRYAVDTFDELSLLVQDQVQVLSGLCNKLLGSLSLTSH